MRYAVLIRNHSENCEVTEESPHLRIAARVRLIFVYSFAYDEKRIRNVHREHTTRVASLSLSVAFRAFERRSLSACASRRMEFMSV